MKTKYALTEFGDFPNETNHILRLKANALSLHYDNIKTEVLQRIETVKNWHQLTECDRKREIIKQTLSALPECCKSGKYEDLFFYVGAGFVPWNKPVLEDLLQSTGEKLFKHKYYQEIESDFMRLIPDYKKWFKSETGYIKME